MPTIELSNLKLEPISVSRQRAAVDLSLIAEDSARGLALAFEYSTELFDEITIAQLADQLQTLLTSIVQEPGQLISSLAILSQVERDRLLALSDRSHSGEWQGQTVLQLFERQVQQVPNNLAVVQGNSTFTYQQLGEQSDCLAKAIERMGVKPGYPIAVLIDDGPQQALVLLAILKVGCYFVCLDASHPLTRLKQIISETNPVILIYEEITHERQKILIEHFCEEGRSTICLDSLSEKSEPVCLTPIGKSEIFTMGSDPVYIVFTSGSTGKPKGIVQSHRSFSQFVEWFISCFSLDSSKRLAQWAAITYDAAYCEIFAALCSGAALCIPPSTIRFDPSFLVQWLKRNQIHIFQTVPSFFRQLIHCLESEYAYGENVLPMLQQVLLAGEVLDVALAHDWLSRVDNRTALFNLYGPTETILATYFRVTLSDLARQRIPVGKPIDGRQIIVLDTRGRLCPAGIQGEVCVRSQYLSSGYLNQTLETQRSFVQNPLSPDDGTLVYRTGDLGYLLSDGNLIVRGRLDDQCKIRGVRVELGEIEACLRCHQSVLECAVLFDPTTFLNEPQITAYIVKDEASSLNAFDLRRFLKTNLPAQMLPTSFFFVSALPITHSGKIDRRALSVLELETRQTPDETRVAPRNVLEQRLLVLWEQTLGHESIGVTDNFFDLGGHSMLAVRLMARVQAEFSRSLPLVSLFKDGTIEDMAIALEQDTHHPSSALVLIRSSSSGVPFFCVHPVGGNVLCYFELAQLLSQTRPFYAFQSLGLVDTQYRSISIEEMAASYVEIILEARPVGPYFIGGWSMGGILAYEMAQQLMTRECPVASLTLIDSPVPSVISAQTIDRSEQLCAIAAELGIDFDLMELRTLGIAQGLNLFLQKAKSAHVLPELIDLEQVERLLEVFELNFSALKKYKPSPYNGPINFLTATKSALEGDARKDWETLVGDEAKYYIVPGNHYSLLKPPHVVQLSILLETLLSEAEAQL